MTKPITIADAYFTVNNTVIFPSTGKFSKTGILSTPATGNTGTVDLRFKWIKKDSDDINNLEPVITGTINFYYKLIYDRDDSQVVGVDLDHNGIIDKDASGKDIFKYQGAPYDSVPVLLGSKSLLGGEVQSFQATINKKFGGGLIGAMYIWCEYVSGNYSNWNTYPETTPNSWMFTDFKLD